MHYQKWFEENKKNCRALSIGIKEIFYSKNKNKTSSPSSLIQNSKTITDQKHIAEHFNNFFTSIDKKLQKNIPPTKKHFSSFLKNPNNLTLFITPTTAEEVNDLISDLKVSKSKESSNLPTKIMKQLSDTIESPLAELINKSFQSGTFPDIFKIAKVIPIFKSESRVLCNNYRPISLLSSISKLIGKLMHKRVYSFLEQQNWFYNAQLGFCLSLITNNALVSITENIQSQLDQNKFCARVLVDLKKAFDTKDHEILPKKLSHYGIRGIGNEWFCSYLTKRKQYVIIGNQVSTLNEISTGVPQESVLGNCSSLST